jgi:hypothetical protein
MLENLLFLRTITTEDLEGAVMLAIDIYKQRNICNWLKERE